MTQSSHGCFCCAKSSMLLGVAADMGHQLSFYVYAYLHLQIKADHNNTVLVLCEIPVMISVRFVLTKLTLKFNGIASSGLSWFL